MIIRKEAKLNNKILIEETEKHIKSILGDEYSGHDWFHANRVRNIALTIAKNEDIDILVLELAALLHDLNDYKLVKINPDMANYSARKWLLSKNVDGKIIDKIEYIIDNSSFSKSLESGASKAQVSMEQMILSDADKVDAIGAIGIARTFSFGGVNNCKMHDPDRLPRKNMSVKEYQNLEESTTINHFYEKLLLLDEKMYTDEGKRIAKERIEFMKIYLDKFYEEWDGVS